MQALDLEAFEGEAEAFDRAVSRTRDIDCFCSSSAWALPAHLALSPPRDLLAWKCDDGWALFARHEGDEWSAMTPLEMGWCLACPFACTGDPDALMEAFAAECHGDRADDVVFLSGLAPKSPLLDAAITAFRKERLLLTSTIPPCVRYRARLDGGLPGFLSRRSPGFRMNIRQAERKADKRGVLFEQAPCTTYEEAMALHARLLAVEMKSWKGKAGEGMASPTMQEFYRLMLPRLARRGAVRAMVGRREGEDVAILVGGVIGTPDGVVFRGLQFSFDDDYRALSLGNLAQLAIIECLAAEGVALYDLGSDVDYKRRWGEECFTTVTVTAVPLSLAARR